MKTLRLDGAITAAARLRLTTRIAAVLFTVAFGAVAVYYASDAADAWMPSLATDAASIAVTLAIIERLIDRQRAREASGRVVQVLSRIQGDLHVLADFLVWDYSDLHRDTYVRPPFLDRHEPYADQYIEHVAVSVREEIEDVEYQRDL